MGPSTLELSLLPLPERRSDMGAAAPPTPAIFNSPESLSLKRNKLLDLPLAPLLSAAPPSRLLRGLLLLLPCDECTDADIGRPALLRGRGATGSSLRVGPDMLPLATAPALLRMGRS